MSISDRSPKSEMSSCSILTNVDKCIEVDTKTYAPETLRKKEEEEREALRRARRDESTLNIGPVANKVPKAESPRAMSVYIMHLEMFKNFTPTVAPDEVSVDPDYFGTSSPSTSTAMPVASPSSSSSTVEITQSTRSVRSVRDSDTETAEINNREVHR
ncbi:unnamed protein product [Anisakis simplex]|uniref:Flocculation protein FLO11-like n=1 Tax=Anisakis simplex TaxID=6269 RepID=A0A0M3JW14_ANISI|nr:unnamed protein product [Anisakis simplex]